MIFIGIDVAKDKHDCCIVTADNVVLKQFTISNNVQGFDKLLENIALFTNDLKDIKIGLEATGHYSHNILGYLLDKELAPFIMNPLQVNIYKKSQSLRKTKTDTVDALVIANILKSNINFMPYTNVMYNNEELKSLTRYRLRKIRDKALRLVILVDLIHRMLF